MIDLDMSPDAVAIRAMAFAKRWSFEFRLSEDCLRIDCGMLPLWPDTVQRIKSGTAAALTN